MKPRRGSKQIASEILLDDSLGHQPTALHSNQVNQEGGDLSIQDLTSHNISQAEAALIRRALSLQKKEKLLMGMPESGASRAESISPEKGQEQSLDQRIRGRVKKNRYAKVKCDDTDNERIRQRTQLLKSKTIRNMDFLGMKLPSQWQLERSNAQLKSEDSLMLTKTFSNRDQSSSKLPSHPLSSLTSCLNRPRMTTSQASQRFCSPVKCGKDSLMNESLTQRTLFDSAFKSTTVFNQSEYMKDSPELKSRLFKVSDLIKSPFSVTMLGFTTD